MIPIASHETKVNDESKQNKKTENKQNTFENL